MRPTVIALLCIMFAETMYTQTSISGKADLYARGLNCSLSKRASRNSAPTVRGDALRGEEQTIRFPENYGEELQVPVYCAMQALLSEEDEAVDPLLEHSDDPRYSYSVNSCKDYNVTVCGACANIEAAMLIGFEDELHVVSRSQFGIFPLRGDPFSKPKEAPSLFDYWREHGSLGVPGIQIQAIDRLHASCGSHVS